MRTLRARILAVTLLVTGLAVLAFGVPLAVALTRLENQRVVLSLEREASHVIATVPDEALSAEAAGERTPLPHFVTHRGGMLIGIYAASGARLAGAGPATSPLAARATGLGHDVSGTEAGQLVAALSLRADRPSTAAVRVAIAGGDVHEDALAGGLAMLGLGVAILAVAGLGSFLLARRLTRPLERLAGSARLLGDGDFTVRTPASGLPEIDAVAASVDATAARLGALLERERAFSSNASHQLRSPLTALRLNLETGALDGADPQAVAAVVAELDRLEATLDGLLALTRDIEPPRAPFTVPPLLAQLAARWQGPATRAGRALRVHAPEDLPHARGSAASLGHVLDVLVDNALQHGRGLVSVAASSGGGVVKIDVSDEGDGVAGDPEAPFQRRSHLARGHGIGLSLARSLVEADGGRLDLTRTGPRPVFTVLLPAQSQSMTQESEPAPAVGEPVGG